MMKKTKNKLQKKLVLIGFLLITSISFAQLPGFDDSVEDTTPAPVTSILALGLITGAIYGIRKVN